MSEDNGDRPIGPCPDQPAPNGLEADEAEQPEEHTTSLKADKPGLSTGAGWTEIKMADADSQEPNLDDPARTTAPEQSTLDAFPSSNCERDLSYELEGSTGGSDKTRPSQPSPTIRISKELPSTPPAAEHDGRKQTSPPEPALDTRTRAKSTSTSTSTSHPVSSTVFVALENIDGSKEARKSKELRDSVQAALLNIKDGNQDIDPEFIFRPLQLTSKTFSIPLQVTALDCIGKLISYSYFAFPSAEASSTQKTQKLPQQPPLIERAIETICDCFENEATPVEIQQQIVKSLLAAVLNDKIVVHGAGLLKAVRQIYNR